jgi:hypothetical protein
MRADRSLRCALRRVAVLSTMLLLGGGALVASAHPLPGSAVLLDFEEQAVQAELRLPLADLEIGFTHDREDPAALVEHLGPIPFTSAPARVIPAYGAELGRYIVRHVRPVAFDGRPWAVTVEDLSLDTAQSPLDVVAHLRLSPPAGVSAGRFTLNYDVITHEVLTHEALVSVRSDWNNGVMSNAPELVGRIRWVVKAVAIDRPAGSGWAGFRAALRLGMDHIAEGTDHLMFLLTLLLPAPLLASGGRWARAGGNRRTLKRLAAIVSAFTIGHTITLVAGAQGWLSLPQAPIEVAIAVSILVSAVHAWRPIFPGRESWVAAGFGLVHGASFASVIAAQRFDAWHRVVAMFGFNLGIEVMQVAVVAAALPCLLLMCSLPVYRFVRDAGAAFAGLAALGWVLERTVGIANPLGGLIDGIAADAPLAILSATAIALALRVLAQAANTRPRMGRAGEEGETARNPDAPPRARTAWTR